MRLPLSKVYRAFPELDPFSDADCERYVLQARTRGRTSRELMILTTVAAGVLTAIVLTYLTLRLIVPAAASLGYRRSRVQDLDVTLGFLFIVGASFISGFLVRDAWLIRAIRACIRTARCPACDYSLLGLRVHQGRVICPECGAAHILRSLGITPEDILSRESPAHPSPADAVRPPGHEHPAA